MNIKKLTLTSADFPEVLRDIPSPPKQLYVAGDSLDELLKRPRVAIVGSRKVSPYGEQVTRQLARELAEQGVVIVSGLALGVDALSHQAALSVGGLVIAVLPCRLDKIVPATNLFLAHKILDNGGVLVSEYGGDDVTFKQNFIARNRLMSGLANAVLITEAAEKSGALHTANFAIKQGRDVLAVPGSIYAEGCVGTNNLIKAVEAGAVTSYKDVIHALHLEDHQTPARDVRGRNAHEQTILDLLLRGVSEGDELLDASGLSVPEFSQALTMLEISSKIRALGANYWAIF
jgi:DNA processing protein